MMIIPTIVAVSIFKDIFGHVKTMCISTQHKFISIHLEAPSSQLPLRGLCNIVTFLKGDVGMSLLLSQSILLIS